MSDLTPFTPTEAFEYTASPNPSWTYGQRIEETVKGRKWMEGEKSGWKVIDASTYDPRKMTSLLFTAIVPRPIAFVSTVSPDGTANIAPYSWFNEVISDPPLISFSAIHQGDSSKDTVRNIRSGKGFTINMISEPWIEQADICSHRLPYGTSEWPISGLTKVESIHVKAPRVRESALSMECELFQTIDIHHPTTSKITATLVLGLIKYIHIRNDILDPEQGTVDPGKLKPVAKIGGHAYARVSQGYVIPRRPLTEVEEAVERLKTESEEKKNYSEN